MFYLRRIAGDSMAPTFKNGQIILAVQSWRPKLDDVVIVRHGEREKIKRLAKVRAGEVYVLGDNLANSTDSRAFGWLDKTVVKAKVIWPRR